MNIVILDGHSVTQDCLTWKELKCLGDVIIYSRTTSNEVIERAKDAEIILTNKVKISAETLGRLPKLKYIGVLATGYNIVDVEAASSRGITVTNIPAYSTSSVVQMTFAHILHIINDVAHYSEENKNGRWSNAKDFCYLDKPLNELAGLRIGIIGLGNIGKRVAQVALAFGMKAYAVTRKSSAELPANIQKTTFENALSTCDIITLHCPLTESTHQMISKTEIEKMRDGMILINTSRGALVNEADIAEALYSGKLRAYGADVMCEEPPSEDNKLLSAPNAFITPHIAWATQEARQRLIDIATQNVRAFIKGEPENTVNK